MKVISEKYILSVKRDRKLEFYVFTFRKNHKLYGHCQIVWAKDEKTARRLMATVHGKDEGWWFFYNHHTWDEYERLMERYGHKQTKTINPMLFEEQEEEMK